MRYNVIIKLKKDFIEVNGDTITVGVLAPPEKGKANNEALRKIADHFKLPVACVRVVSGYASRRKIVEID